MAEMRRLQDKIEEMKTQRTMLEDQFRGKVQGDDITNALVTQKDVNQEVRFYSR